MHHVIYCGLRCVIQLTVYNNEKILDSIRVGIDNMKLKRYSDGLVGNLYYAFIF